MAVAVETDADAVDVGVLVEGVGCSGTGALVGTDDVAMHSKRLLWPRLGDLAPVHRSDILQTVSPCMLTSIHTMLRNLPCSAHRPYLPAGMQAVLGVHLYPPLSSLVILLMSRILLCVEHTTSCESHPGCAGISCGSLLAGGFGDAVGTDDNAVPVSGGVDAVVGGAVGSIGDAAETSIGDAVETSIGDAVGTIIGDAVETSTGDAVGTDDNTVLADLPRVLTGHEVACAHR